MNLFDRLVQQAMQSENALGTVRPAVEKELLHHDILREMSEAGLLSKLVFIGGTCLRTCYGSTRLSEDLDFTGGADFDVQQLAKLGTTLKTRLMDKYGLPVSVSEPIREDGNVKTWKLRIQTRPENQHLPAQRIHIDVCALPSRDARPALLRNRYGIDMGTGGLIVQAESLQEIYADKWVALAFRPNRVQYRDLWDLLWMEQQSVQLNRDLVFYKLEDRTRTRTEFFAALQQRIQELEADVEHPALFRKEMERFLPEADVQRLIQNPGFWPLLIHTLHEKQALLQR